MAFGKRFLRKYFLSSHHDLPADRRISAITPLPQRVPENDDPGARAVVFLREPPTKDGMNAEHVEEIRRDAEAEHLFLWPSPVRFPPPIADADAPCR